MLALVRKEFGEFGHVVDIELPMTARGVAFVQFDNPRDASEAMEEVTGRRLKGMVLKVFSMQFQADMLGSLSSVTLSAFTGVFAREQLTLAATTRFFGVNV